MLSSPVEEIDVGKRKKDLNHTIRCRSKDWSEAPLRTHGAGG